MVASSINCQLESCLDTVDNFESLEIYKADFYSYRIKEILWIVDQIKVLSLNLYELTSSPGLCHRATN
jgi:hypothetical protein